MTDVRASSGQDYVYRVLHHSTAATGGITARNNQDTDSSHDVQYHVGHASKAGVETRVRCS